MGGKSGLDLTLNGVTCPWNTLAVWDVQKLAQIGFPLVAEGVIDGQAGVEEVSAVAVHQKFGGPRSRLAKLVKFKESDVLWHTDFSTPERIDWHKRKMFSKVQRAQAHLTSLEGVTGFVQHIVHGEDAMCL